MSIWLYLIGAWATIVLCSLIFSSFIRRLIEEEKNKTDAIFAMLVIGTIIAFIWPLSLVVLSILSAVFYKELFKKEV